MNNKAELDQVHINCLADVAGGNGVVSYITSMINRNCDCFYSHLVYSTRFYIPYFSQSKLRCLRFLAL